MCVLYMFYDGQVFIKIFRHKLYTPYTIENFVSTIINAEPENNPILTTTREYLPIYSLNFIKYAIFARWIVLPYTPYNAFLED